jgi:hypothetical protein
MSKIDKIAKAGTTGFAALASLGQSEDAEAIPIGRLAAGFKHVSANAAEKALAEGRNARDVWDATGTYILRDKKARQEIPDTDSYVIKRGVKKLQEIGPRGKRYYEYVPLEEVFSHDELYKQYPWMREFKVRNITPLERSEGYKGLFDPQKQVIAIDFSRDGHHSTLLHEITHKIQNYEGFAGGGNPEMFDNAAADIVATLAQKKGSLANTYSAYLDKAENNLQKALESGDEARIANARTKFESAFMDHKKAYEQSQELERYSSSLTPDQQYRRLQGEWEAKQAEKRFLVGDYDTLPTEADYPGVPAYSRTYPNPESSPAHSSKTSAYGHPSHEQRPKIPGIDEQYQAINPKYYRKKKSKNITSDILDTELAKFAGDKLNQGLYSMSAPGRGIAGLVGLATGSLAEGARLAEQDQDVSGDALEDYINKYQKDAPWAAPVIGKLAKMANLAYSFGM